MNNILTRIALSLPIMLAMESGRAIASDVPTPECMAASLRSQIAQAGASFQADYIVASTGAAGARVRQRVHYVRAPDHLALKETMERYSDSKQAWESRSTTKHRYEIGPGDLTILHTVLPKGPTDASVERGRGGVSGSRFARHDIPDAAAYPILGVPLYEALQRGAEVKGQEDVDCHKCWKVEFTGQRFGTTAAKCVAWLDPGIGFCPRKLQIVPIASPSAPLTEVDFEAYHDAGSGVWAPERITVLGKTPKGTDAGLVVNVIRIDVGSVLSEDNASKRLPSGTKVYDKTLEATYTVP